MSTHLREDKECQNCGRTVEEVYCPRCGQKNTETRQSFAHLVAHFAEDLTHYDGAFWKTMKYLLFRPAYLTQQYLQGKRQSYVPPVKLYIFISFLFFVIPSLVPSPQRLYDHFSVEQERPAPDVTRKENTEIAGLGWDDTSNFFLQSPVGYRTLKEMDSIERIKPDSLKLSGSEYKRAEEIVQLYERNNPYEVGNMFAAKFPQLLSKAIFIYMPIFAFWLWLFHNKKRWYFFEHGIFTLHYFSFLMITTSVIATAWKLYLYLQSDFLSLVSVAVMFLLWFWQAFYFYSSHKRMYYESATINFIKSTALFIINVFCILVMLLLLVYQSYNTLE